MHLDQILAAADLPDPVQVLPAPPGEWPDPPLVLITAGEDVLVGIAVYPDRLMVGPGRIRWDGPAHPVPTLRDPQEIPLGDGIDPATAEPGVCDGCATRHLGVVF